MKALRAAIALLVVLYAACGSSTNGTGSAGNAGASGQAGSTGGAAGTNAQGGAGGTTGQGGADGGAAGTTGGGGAAGTGGRDAGAAMSYACGSDTCMPGQTFCYSFSGGVPGSGTSRSCKTVPAACAKNPPCACLCPPVAAPAFGCSYVGGSASGSCTCSEANAELTVTCAGA